MKLTENMDAHMSAFEQAEGKTIKPQVVVLIKAMAATGDRFENLGEKDAACGRAQRTKEAFVEWGRRELADPEDRENPIVDLMYKCYLDGYNAGKEAHHV